MAGMVDMWQRLEEMRRRGMKMLCKLQQSMQVVQERKMKKGCSPVCSSNSWKIKAKLMANTSFWGDDYL